MHRELSAKLDVILLQRLLRLLWESMEKITEVSKTKLSLESNVNHGKLIFQTTEVQSHQKPSPMLDSLMETLRTSHIAEIQTASLRVSGASPLTPMSSGKDVIQSMVKTRIRSENAHQMLKLVALMENALHTPENRLRQDLVRPVWLGVLINHMLSHQTSKHSQETNAEIQTKTKELVYGATLLMHSPNGNTVIQLVLLLVLLPSARLHAQIVIHSLTTNAHQLLNQHHTLD